MCIDPAMCECVWLMTVVVCVCVGRSIVEGEGGMCVGVRGGGLEGLYIYLFFLL